LSFTLLPHSSVTTPALLALHLVPPSLHDLGSAPPTSSVLSALDSSCILDSGCTGHYIHMHTPHTHRLPAAPGISVLLANGQSITSSHTATRDLHPSLPPSATIAHIFPALLSGALLSIGLLCDHGCTANFHQNDVTIALAKQPIPFPDYQTVGRRPSHHYTTSSSSFLPIFWLTSPTTPLQSNQRQTPPPPRVHPSRSFVSACRHLR
jgi:hypothetical protein